MTTPMPETMSPREKVAAVLDPEIWADDMPVPTRAAVTDFHARRKASVIKADAILAALASSGDHAELARLTVVATDAASLGDGLQEAALTRFQAHANPAAVLALIAVVAALRGERDEWRKALSNAQNADAENDALLRARATEAERKLAEADKLNVRAADLMRQCTDPDRFEGASTLNVYVNMRAWLSDLSKEAERG